MIRAALRLVLLAGAVLAGAVGFERSASFLRALLGRVRDIVGSLLARGGDVVSDLFARRRHLLGALFRFLRHDLGVALDRLGDASGAGRDLRAHIRGRIVRRLGNDGTRRPTNGDEQSRGDSAHSWHQHVDRSFRLRKHIAVLFSKRRLCTLPVPPTGSESRNITSSGTHSRATRCDRNSRISSRCTFWPGLRTTNSSGRSCHFACFTPMTAAAATAGWPAAAFSRSIELIHSPPVLIRSLTRSLICMVPCASMVAMSPVGNHPSRSGDESLL